MKKILLLPIVALYFISIKPWLFCTDLLDYYHFSFFDLTLQVNNGVTYDYNVPLLITRIFHNKILQFILDMYKRYTHFFDLGLLTTLLSFVGFVGVLFGIWYFFKNKKKNWIIGFSMLAVFLFPFVQIMINPKIAFTPRILIIGLPFYGVSLFGHYQFIKNNKNLTLILVYLILITLSIGWITNFPQEAYKYCFKP